VWIALGLFVTLWWTWVGFAVLYNRHGDDEPAQRLLFLAGSVPAAVAAVAIEPASTGDAAVYPARSREALRRVRREGDVAALTPDDPAAALEAHHFAERFGLFLIILLGEVVVEAGQASVSGAEATAGTWAALVAAMVLAGALWWVYFDSIAEINLKVLELSGGSPTMARAIFAVGHMLPCFALLLTAAGVGLLLEEDPPRIAFWLACVGPGMYLAGTRAFMLASSRIGGLVRLVLLVATFQLARLRPELSPHVYLWLLTAWVVMCAALTTRRGDDDAAVLDRYLGGRARARR
jgi:low temperature requirement protein LtrA